MENIKEEKSFSLGRLDIVDLYEWKNTSKLVYQTYFQRQFVWKEKDKKDLIDTIMKGFPIPAIFICDAGTDFLSLSKKYNVLDGRQRLESIFEFLENKYSYNGKCFKDMDEDEKKRILNYNITLIQMYIDPNDTEKIKEIFKRLNKNSYNLNRMEKQSTQLVEYDYMIIAKIVAGIIQFENIDSYLDEIHTLFPDDDVEETAEKEVSADESDFIPENVKEICKEDNIKYINEILSGDIVFTPYDRRRQIALQYFLNIFTCILKEEMINRNVTEKTIIELSEKSKEELEKGLVLCNEACQKLLDIYEEKIDPFWKNKTSFFTLLYLLSTEKDLLKNVDAKSFCEILNAFQRSNTDNWEKYYEASNQGVNDKKVREQRVVLLKALLKI